MPVEIQWVRYDILLRHHNRTLSALFYKQAQKKEISAKKIAYHLLSDAIHQKASDIHIENYQNTFRVRFRCDGLLHEIVQLPIEMSDEIISCIKVLAQLDISIKRMPQDGRLHFRSHLGFYKDCRISTCPTLYGEKIVIRLLECNAQTRALDELGLCESSQTIITNTIAQPQGLILVTGPTGS